VDLGNQSIRLLLPTNALSGIAPPTRPSVPPGQSNVIPLHHALSNVLVKLSVEVSQPELTLGYLKSLAVGDVLALPTRVDHSLRVVGPGDTTICRAHLGSLAGSHAIELVKSAS
jgi:flagellar motor switch protein FliM